MYVYKGVIFDLDGTLLNSIDDIKDALNFALKKTGLNEVSVEEVKNFVGSGVHILMERALKYQNAFGEKFDQNYNVLYENYMAEYERCRSNNTKPYDGMIEVLKKLKDKGIKLGVLSNKPDRDTKAIGNKYFGDIFDIVYGNIPEYEVKPNPRLLNHMIDQLGLDRKEILYVGDSEVDIMTAKNAYVDSLGASYGFRSKELLIKSGAKYIINNPSQIMYYFKEEIDGVLLLDKPYKITSQDAITKVKRLLNVKKIGHAGTLDPLATGLLVVLLGDATKLSNYLLEESKEYLAEIVIGETTKSLDRETEVCEHVDVTTLDNIDEVLKSMEGDISLVPPIYSAIKVDGMKLYDAARKGKNVEIKARDSHIYKIERTSNIIYENGTCRFSFICKVSKGTYIRSLCEEIGKRFGLPAYMYNLRRIASGKMTLENANTFEDLENGKYYLTSMLNSIGEKKIVHINDAIFKRVNNGMRIILKFCNDEEVFLAYKNKLVGIYTKNKEQEFSYEAKRVWKLEE